MLAVQPTLKNFLPLMGAIINKSEVMRQEELLAGVLIVGGFSLYAWDEYERQEVDVADWMVRHYEVTNVDWDEESGTVYLVTHDLSEVKKWASNRMEFPATR